MKIGRFINRRSPGLRAAARHEQLSINGAILHMPTPELAGISEPALRRTLDAAIADGGGILAVGLATRGMEILGPVFSAIAQIKLTTGQRLEVMIEGDIDPKGRVWPKRAIAMA